MQRYLAHSIVNKEIVPIRFYKEREKKEILEMLKSFPAFKICSNKPVALSAIPPWSFMSCDPYVTFQCFLIDLITFVFT